MQGEDPLPNPFPQLRIIWSPLAGSSVQAAGNAPSNYYPGNSYVDVVGGDIYGENFTAPVDRPRLAFSMAQQHGKPFSLPEAGLTDVDDPAFITRLCSFVDTHAATESSPTTRASPARAGISATSRRPAPPTASA